MSTMGKSVQAHQGRWAAIRLSAAVHLTIASVSFALLAGLSALDPGVFATLLGRATENPRITAVIGIEHEQPADVSILIARKGQDGVIEIRNDDAQTIAVSLSADWKRLEVSGAQLEAFHSSEPQFNLIQWTIPPSAGMKLSTPSVPDALNLLSPSSTPTRIRIEQVDLEKNEKTEDVYLMQESVEVKLWKAE